MTTGLPDPEKSRVLLVAVAEYAELDPIPAVENNVLRLKELLTDPELWGLPAANCITIIGDDDPRTVPRKIRDAARAAEDLLLVYYAGHGLVPMDTDQFCLALPSSTKDFTDTALRYSDVRAAVNSARPTTAKAVILDCCYAARAVKGGMGAPPSLHERARIEGACTLTACDETTRALAPPGDAYTAFTGELINALGIGVNDGPEFLDFGTIYHYLLVELEAKSRPRPQLFSKGSPHELCLVRNRCYVPLASPSQAGQSPSQAGQLPNVLRRTTPAVDDRPAATRSQEPPAKPATQKDEVPEGYLTRRRRSRTSLRRGAKPVLLAAAMVYVAAVTVSGIVLAPGGTARPEASPSPLSATGDLGTAGLAPSRWPMFQHDPLHTAQVPAPGIRKPILAWKVHVQGQPGSPVIGPDGTIYVATGMLNVDKTGFLYAFTPAGTVRWRFQLPGLPSSTTPAVAADGTIYVHTGPEGNIAGADRLVAIKPSGTKKWIFNLNRGPGSFGSNELSSPVIGPDGTIYVGSMDTNLYALSPRGTLKWAVSPSASPIQSSPALDASRHILYFQDAGFELLAYGTEGKRKWRAAICGSSGGEPSATVNARTGVIYTAASGCKSLYAINPNGTIRWHHKLGFRPVSTPAIGPDGTIYIGDNGLYAFTPTGVLKWKRLGYTGFSSASPVVTSDGTIYWDATCASSGAQQGLCALSPDGTIRWILGLPPPNSAGLDPAPAIGAGHSLYISAPDTFNAADQTVRKYTG